MFSKTRMLRNVLVKAILVTSMFAVGVAFADPGTSPRPGGGYAESFICQPDMAFGTITCPIEFAQF